MDIVAHNRVAWDKEVEAGQEWTVPVSPEAIAAARRGDWIKYLFLTESQPVPRSWFPANLAGVDVLCLASGGGQQGPILAAAGARVTVFDNSPKQLAQDRYVAQREGLDITTIQGDMADLSVFKDASFELIVHPPSNCFVADVRPVWREAYRVLRPGGHLLAGFVNPFEFIFDVEPFHQGVFNVRHTLPYSDLEQLKEQEGQILESTEMLEFSHTLDDQIGGQLQMGFVLIGLYEARRAKNHPAAKYFPSYIATRAQKPR